MERVEFTPAAWAALVAACRAALPNEACGFLAGRQGRVEKVYPVANRSPSPEWFDMDPRGQMAAFEAMDAAGEELIAVYHSHTDAPARPSATDLQHAGYPDLLQVIVSLAGEPPAVGAFLYAGENYSAMEVTFPGPAS